jgi:hypothetical protein
VSSHPSTPNTPNNLIGGLGHLFKTFAQMPVADLLAGQVNMNIRVLRVNRVRIHCQANRLVRDVSQTGARCESDASQTATSRHPASFELDWEM